MHRPLVSKMQEVVGAGLRAPSRVGTGTWPLRSCVDLILVIPLVLATSCVSVYFLVPRVLAAPAPLPCLVPCPFPRATESLVLALEMGSSSSSLVTCMLAWSQQGMNPGGCRPRVKRGAVATSCCICVLPPACMAAAGRGSSEIASRAPPLPSGRVFTSLSFPQVLLMFYSVLLLWHAGFGR